MLDENLPLPLGMRAVRAEALALKKGLAPKPWRGPVHVPSGGIIAAGWDAAKHVLLISYDGYSLTNAATGERIARDNDPDITYQCLSETGLAFTCLGPEGRGLPPGGCLAACLQATPRLRGWAAPGQRPRGAGVARDGAPGRPRTRAAGT
jgi:hypothetical protein